jgi:hypothetical protein
VIRDQVETDDDVAELLEVSIRQARQFINAGRAQHSTSPTPDATSTSHRKNASTGLGGVSIRRSALARIERHTTLLGRMHPPVSTPPRMMGAPEVSSSNVEALESNNWHGSTDLTSRCASSSSNTPLARRYERYGALVQFARCVGCEISRR